MNIDVPFLRVSFCLLTLWLWTAPWTSAQDSSSLDSLLKEVEHQDPDLVNIDLLARIAMRYTDIDPAEGLKFARQAIALAIRRGTPADQARGYNALASNWLMYLEIDSAKFYYAKALAIHEAEGNKKGMADIVGNLGHIAYQVGRYDEALEYFFKSLHYFEELGYKEGIINQHASLASTYMIQGKHDQAIHHDTLALEGFKELGDSLGYAMVLGNLGNIYVDLEQFDRAADYYTQATKVYERAAEPLGMGRNLVNLTAMYNDQGQYVDALASGLKGLTICRDNNIDLCVRYCLVNIGVSYLKSYMHRDSAGFVPIPESGSRLLQQSIAYLQQAAALTDNLESPRDAQDIYEALSLAYKYSGQFEKALQHHEKYAAIKDSLSLIERTERTEQLTTEREIAVRDKQIELDKLRLKVKRNERIYFVAGLLLLTGWLGFVYRSALQQRKSNEQLGLLNAQISETNLQLEDRNDQLTSTLEELKTTQAQLIEVERQKENEIIRQRISRDIHDDISSGLSKISWMTEILRNPPTTQTTNDHEMLNRIATYSRETVSKLGEIIWSTKPESDTLSGLLSYCREFLSKYLDGLSIRSHIHLPDVVEDIALNPELRRNLYLVLKESVHNAVKYSQATDIYIQFQLQDNMYSLVVEDNGIGMDVSEVAAKGNGMRNMESRMHDVHGLMSVVSAPGKGTRIEFTGKVY